MSIPLPFEFRVEFDVHRLDGLLVESLSRHRARDIRDLGVPVSRRRRECREEFGFGLVAPVDVRDDLPAGLGIFEDVSAVLELDGEPLADGAEPGFQAEKHEDVDDVVPVFQRSQVRDGHGRRGEHRTQGFRQCFGVSALGSVRRLVLVDDVALSVHDRRFRVAGFDAQELLEDGVEAPLVAVVVEVTDPVVPFEPELSGQLADRDGARVFDPFGARQRTGPGSLFVLSGTLVDDVAVPVVLVGPHEPQVVLVESDGGVDRRLELGDRPVRTDDHVPPQRRRIPVELDPETIGGHRWIVGRFSRNRFGVNAPSWPIILVLWWQRAVRCTAANPVNLWSGPAERHR